ncbi:hypothetical protein GCM10027271_10750 [Saccharopolyspora gloriosae]
MRAGREGRATTSAFSPRQAVDRCRVVTAGSRRPPVTGARTGLPCDNRRSARAVPGNRGLFAGIGRNRPIRPVPSVTFAERRAVRRAPRGSGPVRLVPKPAPLPSFKINPACGRGAGVG